MTFSFKYLFQNNQTVEASNHRYANWELVGYGDIIKLPNTLSYRVVYSLPIMSAAKQRAQRISVTLTVTKDDDFIYFHFGKSHFTGNNNGPGMPPPKHSGQGYAGEDKICQYPATFGQITSINFYKTGDDTE